MINTFNRKAEDVVLKTALHIPLNSYCFRFLLVVASLWIIFKYGRFRGKIGSIIRYKKAINNSQSNFVFLFNCILRNSYDEIFLHLLAENPHKHLKYICIEGEEYVRRLIDKDTGVILISGHFGPMFRTQLFKEVFGIGVSSFATADNKKMFCDSSKKRYKIISSFPIYAVGEEKQFQEGLLKKEWINFLNDVPVKKRGFHNYTLFGKNIYLSEFPFKISLKYNIPILFVGTTRIKHQYQVSFLPIDEFYTQQEGLEKYLAIIEKLLCRDPYAGSFIAEYHF